MAPSPPLKPPSWLAKHTPEDRPESRIEPTEILLKIQQNTRTLMTEETKKTSPSTQLREARTQSFHSAIESWNEIHDRAERLQRDLEGAELTISLQHQRIEFLEKQNSELRALYEHHHLVNNTVATKLHAIAIMFNDAIQGVKDGVHSKPPEIVPPSRIPELSDADLESASQLGRKFAPEGAARPPETPK
jgi:hypothetical protein